MSNLISVKKKNEAFLEVVADPSIEMEISDCFTFEVPGARFHPLVKNKMWDGMLRIYNRKNHTLPGGLLKELENFARTGDYQIEHFSSEFGLPDDKTPINRDEFFRFVGGLNLHAKGKPISPRDYQLEAAYHALTNQRAILLSPTASGKSLIIYLMIRWHLARNRGASKILLIVPTTQLVEQIFKDFADYSVADPSWKNSDECHLIYSGKEKFIETAHVTISTWQSIFKLSPAWFAPYDFVIGDEAHGFKAKSLGMIMEKLVNAKYRVGTSGTLDGATCNTRVLTGHFGPIHQVTTTRALIDSDTISDFSISVLLLKYNDEYCKMVKVMDYQAEVDFLVTHQPRNRFIKNLALSQKGNTLILYNFVGKHGVPLFELISKSDPSRKVFFISGGVETEEREKIRNIVEKETNAIIVASLGTFSTGVDIRNLHAIIFASPTKSQIRVLQSIGRGLRKSDNGVPTKIFDIADDLHWKKSRNFTLNHSAERLKIYTREKFDVKIFEIPL